MKSRLLFYLMVTAVAAIFLTSSVNAGELSDRWMLELNLGAWAAGNDASVSTSPLSVETTYGGTGMGGGLSFGRWLGDNLAVMISVEERSVDNTVSTGFTGVKTESNVVSRVNLKVRYNPLASTLYSRVQPFISVSVGPVIGHQGKTSVGFTVATESVDETAFGGEIGVGTHFILSRHFILGAEVGAFGMTDFGQPIGGRLNYSGARFGINIGFLFGGSHGTM